MSAVAWCQNGLEEKRKEEKENRDRSCINTWANRAVAPSSHHQSSENKRVAEGASLGEGGRQARKGKQPPDTQGLDPTRIKVTSSGNKSHPQKKI